ncbi:MAG: hypothetical protein IH621_07095 [Krumholzibacteria bacterium]|nr:hypothetical protein [Candidatus Krumholzibacteria bacterium]
MKHTYARMLRNTRILRGSTAAAAFLLLAVPAVAQTGSVEFEPLLLQRTVTCLIAHEGSVYAGLDGGGLAVIPAADPSAAQVWTAGRDLGGNFVTSLAWSGRNLWVGTNGAGLTRVADPGGTPTFRQYTGNLAGLDISAVDGAVVGDAERVWYAVTDAGVGVITNGIAGATYTAERDGLIANRVNAIAVGEDAVWFGSGVGVSRFAGNVFTDQNAGLTDPAINALAFAPDGTLVAGGNGGVYTWDDGAGAWIRLGSPGQWVSRIAWVDGALHTLGLNGQGQGIVSRWTGSAFVGVPTPYATALALAGGTDLWAAGRYAEAGMGSTSAFAWYARGDGGTGWQTWQLDQGTIVGTAEGLTFGRDGRAWIGSFTGQGFGGLGEGGWTNVFALASDANDSSGLINHSGNMLAMAATADGAVWACQYGSGGLLRHDPATGRTDPVRTTDSGLGGRGVVNLVAHPGGPLLVLHDWQDAVKVEVLTDPARWRDPANWIDLPSGVGGLGDGPTVWDAYVQRPDVIWFAVEGTGLVRWDVNGDAAGPDDPLTWSDPSDDRWDAPVDVFPGAANDPKQAKALAGGPDGSIWCGGDGVVRFFYDAQFSYVSSVADFLNVKQSPQVEGLLGGGVYDLATGREGDLWVVTLNGLNRVRLVDDAPVVDAWLDLMNYVGNPSYGTLYSPNVIAPLPGFVYRKVVADPGSRRVLVSGDRGAALVTPTDGGGGGDGGTVLAGAYLYPSPWNPAGEPLGIGGLAATVADPAEVAIYNVEGQLVYQDTRVAGATGFWSGRNRVGAPVATGLYVVRITWRGATELRTLAVVR